MKLFGIGALFAVCLGAAAADYTMDVNYLERGVLLRKDKKFTYELKKDAIGIANIAPSPFCEMAFRVNVPYRPDLLLRFEYKNSYAEDSKPDYSAVNLIDNRKRTCFFSLPVSDNWRVAEVPFSRLRTTTKENLSADDTFVQLNIYSRIAKTRPLRRVALEVRNIKFLVNPAYNPLDNVRISYSALPMFNWSAVKGAKEYELEYSCNPAFPAEKTHKIKVTRNFFTPDAPLPGGMVHYRVRCGQKIVVNDRLFVPTPAHRWRMPSYDFAAVSAMPHPRLLKLAKFYHPEPDKAVREAVKLLKFKLPPNPEPYQEGADPAIRAWVEWYGQIAGGVIGATGLRMTQIGQAAMLGNRSDLIDKARELALGVSRTWDPEGGNSMRNCDLQSTNLLMGLGWCYDAAWRIMTPEERTIVAQAIRIRSNQYWKWVNPFRGNESQNHPWDRAQTVAFAAVTLAEEPLSQEQFDFICQLYGYRFLPSLGFDGENNEGLKYWSYGLGLAIRFVDLAKQVAGCDFYTHPWLARTARFPMYLLPPDGFGVSFADSGRPNHGDKGPINRRFTARLAAEAQDATALWYAGVPRDGKLTAQAPWEGTQSVFYPHIGVAAFNTNIFSGSENVALGFHSGKFFAGHQHADQNSFVINAYGDKLAVDGGYYDWYGSAHFKAYSTRTQAHNTVLVNGRGQAWGKVGADGRVVNYADFPNFGYIYGDASAPEVYQKALTRFNRQMLFIKPDTVLAFDELKSPEPAIFSWLLHSHSAAAIALHGKQSFSFSRPKAAMSGQILLPAAADITVKPAYDVMPVRGYSVEKLANPQPEWTLTAANRNKSQELQFLAVMNIGRDGKSTPSTAWRTAHAANAVAAVSERGVVCWRTASSASMLLEIAGIVTDGACAAVVLDTNGNVADALLIDGTYLKFNGRELLRRQGRGNMALRTASDIKVGDNSTLVRLGERGKYSPLKLRHATRSDINGCKSEMLSGIFQLPDDVMANITVEGLQGDVSLVISSAAARHSMILHPGQGAGLFLRRGEQLINIAGALPRQITITTEKASIRNAPLLPQTTAPRRDDRKIEAEKADRTSPIPPLTVARPFASGGMMSSGWERDGIFAAWDIAVPHDGEYELLLRYAAVDNGILRMVEIDGAPWEKNVGCYRLAATGGFGLQSHEWRYAALPSLRRLSGGTRRLTVRFFNGVANLDALVLRNVNQKKSE